MFCRDLAGAGIVESLVQMLNNGGVQGQVYAARALTNMASDPAVQDQMVALGAVPHFVGIMRDNVGAAPAAAGAIERLAGQPRFGAAIIRQGGVSALVGLLNAGVREAFLPAMRSLRQLSGEQSRIRTTPAFTDGRELLRAIQTSMARAEWPFVCRARCQCGSGDCEG